MAALLLSPLNFTLLDWLALAILVYSIVVSWMKGFIREILGLLSMVLAFIFAGWFYRSAAGLFKEVVKTENLALFLGFSLVFVGTLLLGSIAIWVITKVVKFARIEWADRCLGAAFGFIRGWVFGSIIFLGLTAFNVQTERVHDSELAPYFLPGARVIVLVTPYELKARFLVGYRAVEQWWRSRT